MSSGTLGCGVLGAYGAPSFAQAFIHGPAVSVLQGIYAKFFGLSLQEIAFVILISRIFDAVNDPVVGFLSDRYRARHGTRKPWLLAGSMIAVIACWFLYVPSGEVTMWSFLFWYLLADVGWTVSEVPYSAWLAELSDDYEERARITTWRSMGRFLGLLSFFGLPLALQSITGSTEFTPETLRWAAGLASVALLGTALVAALVVPNGLRREHAASGAPASSLLATGRAVAGNRPLLIFTAMFAVGGLGAGIGSGLSFFYIDGYLLLGQQLAAVMIVSIPISLIATPVWGTLCRRFGKQQAWAAGNVGAGLASLSYYFIGPGENAALLLAASLIVVNAMIVVEAVAAPAVLADVVDYGRLRFGADHAGSYFAFYAMVQKINVGIGAALGLLIAGMFGFDATVTTQSASGRFGLLLAFSLLPAVFLCIAALWIWRFPINRRRHAVIIAALERRAAREAPGENGQIQSPVATS